MGSPAYDDRQSTTTARGRQPRWGSHRTQHNELIKYSQKTAVVSEGELETEVGEHSETALARAEVRELKPGPSVLRRAGRIEIDCGCHPPFRFSPAASSPVCIQLDSSSASDIVTIAAQTLLLNDELADLLDGSSRPSAAAGRGCRFSILLAPSFPGAHRQTSLIALIFSSPLTDPGNTDRDPRPHLRSERPGRSFGRDARIG